MQACLCRLIVRPRIEEAAKGKMITDFILFLPLSCRPLDNTQTVWQTVWATVEGEREGQRDIKLATKSLPLTASRSRWPFFSLCLQLPTFIFTAFLLYRKTHLLEKKTRKERRTEIESGMHAYGVFEPPGHLYLHPGSIWCYPAWRVWLGHWSWCQVSLEVLPKSDCLQTNKSPQHS